MTKEYKVGQPIRWTYTMLIYSVRLGRKGHRIIGETCVKVKARVSTKGGKGRYAQVEDVRDWVWSSGNSGRKKELGKAFRVATGLNLWGLTACLEKRYPPYILNRPEPLEVLEAKGKVKAGYKPISRTLGPPPGYSVNACKHCGGTVHTDYDDHGEVRRCMACGRP